MKKKIVLVLIVLLVVIQFIRPGRNGSVTASTNEISGYYSVPDTVAGILKRSCYNCHSNNTSYPWYTNIQPVGWWMQHHVNEGKDELNFSEFGGYTAKRQHHKMEEIAEQVKKGEMPLNSYLWVHTDARLSESEKEILIAWANELGKRIAEKGPL